MLIGPSTKSLEIASTVMNLIIHSQRIRIVYSYDNIRIVKVSIPIKARTHRVDNRFMTESELSVFL